MDARDKTKSDNAKYTMLAETLAALKDMRAKGRGMYKSVSLTPSKTPIVRAGSGRTRGRHSK